MKITIIKKTNKDYLKKFYENLENKYITCECGQEFLYSNRSKHNKTKRHILLCEMKNKLTQNK